MATQYKILVIAPSWVGDAVMAESLFKALKRRHGVSLLIDVAAAKYLHSLFMRMPEINEIITTEFPHSKLNLFKRIGLGLRLRSKKYDQAIVLPNSFKSALMPFIAGIRKRTGFMGEMRYILLNDYYKLDKHKLPLLVDRYSALANDGIKPEIIDYPKLTIDTANQARLFKQFSLNGDAKTNQADKIIAFCPGAEYGVSKRYSPEHFAALAVLLLKQGYQIIILGSAKDKPLSQAITQAIPNAQSVFDLCGQTSLADTVDLLGMSLAVITNDTGLMHIAAATSGMVIALYGSSSPKYTPPLTDNARIIWLKLDCSPCFARTCRFGHYNCLRLITPQMVMDELNSLIGLNFLVNKN